MLTRAKSIHPLLVLAGLMAVSLAGLALLPKIPQDQGYHLFADQRVLVGVPNFWNVVSNIPFIVVGAVGLARFRDDAATIVLFLGFFLTGIGSAYYHWDPNDGTLFWDRLPMTISFAAIFSLVIQERPGSKDRGDPALADARNRRSQPTGMGVDRRFASLFLGAILSGRGVDSAVHAVPSKIHARALLAHCRRLIRVGQIVRIHRLPDIFAWSSFERSYAQTPLCRCGVLGHSAILRAAAADPLTGAVCLASLSWR